MKKSIEHLGSQRSFCFTVCMDRELALALLLKQKPMSAPQICSSLLEKIRFDRKKIGKLLADLEWWGELSLTIVVYIAANALCWITVKERYNEKPVDRFDWVDSKHCERPIFFIVLCLR